MSLKRTGLVFDLDGTLIDSTKDITRAVNSVFENHRFPAVSESEVRNAIGPGGKALMEDLLPGSGSPDNLASLLDQFRSEYDNHCTDHIDPYEGIPELVASLENHPTAIVTNKPQSMTEAILNEQGWLDTFDPIYGADLQDELKPSAVPLQSVKQYWSGNDTIPVMIGDTWSDIEAGNKAGFITVGCEYGLGNLRDTQPDHRVTKPGEIGDVIDDLNDVIQTG